MTNLISKIAKTFLKKKKYKQLDYDRFIEKSEVLRFLNSFSEKEQHYKVIFSILVFVGLRPKEAVRLKIDYFSSDFKRVTIKLAKTGKIKQRQVKDDVAEMIKEYAEANISSIIRNKGYLFFVENNNSKNEHIQTSTLRWKVFHKRIELGITEHIVHKKKHHRFVVYSLRRYFITEIVQKTDNIKIAQDIIGHAKISTTARYVKPTTTERQREILDNVFQGYLNQVTIEPEQSTLSRFIS